MATTPRHGWNSDGKPYQGRTDRSPRGFLRRALVVHADEGLSKEPRWSHGLVSGLGLSAAIWVVIAYIAF